MGVFKTVFSVVRFEKLTLSRHKRRMNKAANIDDLRVIAKKRLPGGIFDYIDGGAEDEISLERNVAGYRNIEWQPRVLRDVSTLDTSASLFGRPMSMPLILGPTGFTRIASSQGELDVARAAQDAQLPYTLSTLSTRSIEEVAAASEGRKWFQVYVWKDRALVADMVHRAKECGYEALMLTVDTAVLGRRERDVRRGFTLPPKIGPSTIVDGILHPHWTLDFLRNEPVTFANIRKSSGDTAGSAVVLSSMIANQFDQALSWTDIEWLRSIWNGPIMLKGIQTVADAQLAVSHGVDAISISNHGGRQLDGAPVPIELIEPVVQETHGAIPVICDGGIRRGADIVKAIALGATACSIGRAYLYGLGADGQRGVTRSIEMLRSEMERTMQLCGVTAIDQITRNIIRVRHS
jgi:L-lactate dehydrogenase (cytochrome)